MPSIVLCSKLAYYPMHLEAFGRLCRNYGCRGTVLALPSPAVPSVHQALGFFTKESAAERFPDIDIRDCRKPDRGAAAHWAISELRSLRPDIIWVQEEPNEYYLLKILLAFQTDRRPAIYCAACENIFPRLSFWKNPLRSLLWRRLQGVLAVADASIDGIRRAGMPQCVPMHTLVAGNFDRPTHSPELPPRSNATTFTVGFAGRLCPEKGVAVLFDALEQSPANVVGAIAGDGALTGELRRRAAQSKLADRIEFLGLLPKIQLWDFYTNVDCLAVPSLTTTTWKEQFGGVLADAMACGLPIIGSDSGAIPQVVGPAGLIVAEGSAAELAGAIRKLAADPDLVGRLGRAGRARFEREFGIDAYVRKLARAMNIAGASQESSFVRVAA